MALVLWVLGSIIWNVYILHSYVVNSSGYTAAITSFSIAAIASGFGGLVAGMSIEIVRRLLR
jgi:hypothetical protein